VDEVLDVVDRQAHEIRETPFGAVGVLHAGPELSAWWIWKDQEQVDPEWTWFSREDFLYVVRGALRLEFPDSQHAAVTLHAGESYVIPACRPFRGYRWPREADEPCLFVAVSPADTEEFKRLAD
jgi:mannose-6-phosphate isomerase-like protein (cupin superfamily)